MSATDTSWFDDVIRWVNDYLKIDEPASAHRLLVGALLDIGGEDNVPLHLQDAFEEVKQRLGAACLTVV